MAASIHTYNFRKCSHASVGLAQAHPKYTKQDQYTLHSHILCCIQSILYSS